MSSGLGFVDRVELACRLQYFPYACITFVNDKTDPGLHGVVTAIVTAQTDTSRQYMAELVLGIADPPAYNVDLPDAAVEGIAGVRIGIGNNLQW